MKRLLLGMGACLLVMTAWTVFGHADEPAESAPAAETSTETSTEKPVEKADDASYWMTKKLELSQNVLAGLTKSDFEMIAENAEKMRDLNRFESFVRRRTPAYRTQLRLFQHANAELVRTAEAKNIEGATLAFTQLTTSCVNCHKQLRDLGEEQTQP